MDKDFNYCMKYGSKVIINENNSKQGHRSDLEKVIKDCGNMNVNEVALANPLAYIKYHNGIEKYHRISTDIPRNFKPIVTWVYGPPGSGKTKLVYDRHDINDIWTAPDDLKFFNDYRGQPVALFDDF